MTYFQCQFAETKVEVGNADGVRVQGSSHSEWHTLVIDFSESVLVDVLGVLVPLMPLPLDQLIVYKSVLGRVVDLQDIHNIQNGAQKSD